MLKNLQDKKVKIKIVEKENKIEGLSQKENFNK